MPSPSERSKIVYTQLNDTLPCLSCVWVSHVKYSSLRINKPIQIILLNLDDFRKTVEIYAIFGSSKNNSQKINMLYITLKHPIWRLRTICFAKYSNFAILRKLFEFREIYYCSYFSNNKNIS